MFNQKKIEELLNHHEKEIKALEEQLERLKDAINFHQNQIENLKHQLASR